MTKRSLAVLILCCTWSLGAFAQWGCNNQKNNNLICFVPVTTRSIGATNSPAAAFNSSFATQLSQLPIISSGSGILVKYDPSTGVPSISDNLGPIMTDRAETIGRHKMLLGFAYQHFSFNSIDGNNLNSLPLVFSTALQAGQPTTYTSERVNVNLKLNQYVAVGTFGLTDRVDVSVILPFEQVSIHAYTNGTQYTVGPDNTAQGSAFLPTTSTPGSASGIGDMLINIKGVAWKGENSTFAAGMLFRFPTGDAYNYLGSGAYGFNPYAVLSFQIGDRFSPHGRLGYQANTDTVLIPSNPVAGTGSSTLPGGFQYNIGMDTVVMNKPALVATLDLLGNQINNAPLLVPGTTTLSAPGYSSGPYPDQPTVNSETRTYNSEQLAIGLKMRPWKSLLVYANVTIQLNNVGLRSSPVPLLGASYTFGK